MTILCVAVPWTRPHYQTERQDFKVGKARTYRRHHKVFLVLADKHKLTVAPDPEEVEGWAWMSLDQLCSDDVPKTNTLQCFIKDLP